MKLAFFTLLATVLFIAGCGDKGPGHGFFDDGTPIEDTDNPPYDDGNSGSDDGSDRDTNEPAICLPATGTSGTATIEAGVPVTLKTVESRAMNTMSFGDSPIPARQLMALSRGTGDCATVGVLWMDPDVQNEGTPRLYYQDISNIMGRGPMSQPEIVIDGLSPAVHNASLFFAAECMAIVMKPAGTGYMEYDRSTEGIWSGRMISVAGNSIVTQVSTIAAWQEADGTMMIIGQANVDGVTKGLIGTRTIAAHSEWTFNQFEIPETTQLFSMTSGADGTIHALYIKTEYPCDPCDMDLYYGRLPMDGEWTEEVVQESKWGEPNDEYATEPSMVLDSRGEPVVAATFLVNVITGSTKSAALRLYGRGEDGWCHEVVATEVDGYAGSDGTRMTGIAPSLALDSSDRPHVVFQDMAQWHDGNGWANSVNGQIRYAVRNGKKWTTKTLLTQDGQTEAPNPLNGALPPSLTVSADGRSIHAATATFEWDTDSIYLQTEADIVFTATVIEASSNLP